MVLQTVIPSGLNFFYLVCKVHVILTYFYLLKDQLVIGLCNGGGVYLA